MRPLPYLLTGLALWNLIVFFLYGADKRRARAGKRRIRERTLLALAFLLGGIGAFAGMRVFRHKTGHLRFRICVPLAALLCLAASFLLTLRIFDC